MSICIGKPPHDLNYLEPMSTYLDMCPKIFRERLGALNHQIRTKSTRYQATPERNEAQTHNGDLDKSLDYPWLSSAETIRLVTYQKGPIKQGGAAGSTLPTLLLMLGL